MAERCPAAQPLGRARLPGYRLRFRWVADIERVEGAVVHGVLWKITSEHESILDHYEGFPRHYAKQTVGVFHDGLGQVVEAIAYVLQTRGNSEPPKPSYRDAICHGYREHEISMKQLNMALREAEREYRKEIDGIRRSELDYSDR